LGKRDLSRASGAAERAEKARVFAAVCRALAEVVSGVEGRVRVSDSQVLSVATLRRIHSSLAGKPILHLDATLRLAIAKRLVPRLEVHEIAASAPHMNVRLVAGSFGKSTLCADSRAGKVENQRRANRLAECVDYVRWHAARGGRTLVITYKDCESAFAGIPKVETAHFNAIAGLDRYREVDRLIVIGRPLPSEADLHPLCGAVFGVEPSGVYGQDLATVRMTDGTTRIVRRVRHAHAQAEELRRAICDDEVLQAIGRGRGVNRTEANPLEVHVLADVALPLRFDRIEPWEAVKPDIIHRMLLAGVAVTSPADAAALHPDLFRNAEQAKKVFERDGFKGQNPIGSSYREMSLNSAAYHRTGAGLGTQRAYWLSGMATQVRAELERARDCLEP
jgi:hypothetical protein